MELGIAGKKALVCAASKGLGKGCAVALAREGVGADDPRARQGGARGDRRRNPRRNGREGPDHRGRHHDRRRPRGGAARVSRSPTSSSTTPADRRPGDFRDWDEKAWQAAVNANMITPIMLIRAVVDGMIARKFGRIVNITSTSVKAPIPALGLSNGARAGLTGFIAGIARQVASHNVTINNLLPGPFDTDRLRSTFAAAAKAGGKSVEAIREERRAAESRPPASARPRSSASSAPSCAARRPVTSRAKMLFWMAEPTRARCNICYGPGSYGAAKIIF